MCLANIMEMLYWLVVLRQNNELSSLKGLFAPKVWQSPTLTVFCPFGIVLREGKSSCNSHFFHPPTFFDVSLNTIQNKFPQSLGNSRTCSPLMLASRDSS